MARALLLGEGAVTLPADDGGNGDELAPRLSWAKRTPSRSAEVVALHFPHSPSCRGFPEQRTGRRSSSARGSCGGGGLAAARWYKVVAIVSFSPPLCRDVITDVGYAETRNVRFGNLASDRVSHFAKRIFQSTITMHAMMKRIVRKSDDGTAL